MKNSLRQKALARRAELSATEVESLSQQIVANLFTLLQSMQPCTVGLFHPTRGEPDAMSLVNLPGLDQIDWSLPVCCDSLQGPQLQFARFQAGSKLEAGRYNIPVPSIKQWVKPGILLIPCVGFHRSGERLGYGAGWYDRTLSHSQPRPLAIGVAYSFSESGNRFAELHDQMLDWVVTDQALIRCSPVV